MDFDPLSVTGRVRPAQSAAPLAPLPSSFAPPPPPPSPVPSSEAAEEPKSVVHPDQIEGTGGPPAALSAIASAPPAGSVPLAPGATPGSLPTPTQPDLSPVKTVVPPGGAPAYIAPAQGGGVLQALSHATDEELALIYVVRLMHRLLGPGSLSPVERAFVAGARIMFEQLSAECQRNLDRRPLEVARVSTEMPKALRRAGDEKPAEPHLPVPGGSSARRKHPKSQIKGKSKVDEAPPNT